MRFVRRDVLSLVWIVSAIFVIAIAVFGPPSWQQRDALLGCAVLVNTASLTGFFLRMWLRRTPLRRYGSAIDPAERPRAYNLCMSFLVFMFAAMTIGMAKWLLTEA